MNQDEQPVAAHAASEIFEERELEEEEDARYVWIVIGIVFLTLLFVYYFSHG